MADKNNDKNKSKKSSKKPELKLVKSGKCSVSKTKIRTYKLELTNVLSARTV